MKRKAKCVSVFVMTFLFLGLFIFGMGDLEAKTKIIRLVIPAPAGQFPLTIKDEELAKRFNERAKGEYEIKVFAGGSLAVLPEYFDSVRIGVIEMADSPWGFFSNLDPRLGLVEAPFLFNSFEAASSAAEALLPLHDEVMQERFNAKALGLMNLSGNELVSRKSVKTADDWKGMMVGALSPPQSVMIKMLGASPVVIPYMDVYSSLQKGVIDAAGFNPHGAIALGIMDVCSDLTLFFGTSAWNGYTINLDVWKKMPDHIKQILQEEVNTAVDWMHETQARLNVEDIQTAKKMGKKVHIVDREEREKWAEMLSSFKEEQFVQFGEFGQRVKKIVEEANERYPYKEVVVE